MISRLRHPPLPCLLQSTPYFGQTRLSSNKSSSSKLFADAEAEEKDAAPKKSSSREQPEYENWTGDENIRDAVLRMLVDKYKPLRTGTVRTAEEKIRSMPSARPIIPLNTPSPIESSMSNAGATTSKALKETPEEYVHKPWLVTFKVPSHATITPSIKTGFIPPSPTRAATIPDDPRARARARQINKAAAVPGRLSKAKESTLDYRLGGSMIAVEQARAARRDADAGVVEDDQDDHHTQQRFRANPTSLRAWSSLIEDKIEVVCFPNLTPQSSS